MIRLIVYTILGGVLVGGAGLAFGVDVFLALVVGCVLGAVFAVFLNSRKK